LIRCDFFCVLYFFFAFFHFLVVFCLCFDFIAFLLILFVYFTLGSVFLLVCVAFFRLLRFCFASFVRLFEISVSVIFLTDSYAFFSFCGIFVSFCVFRLHFSGCFFSFAFVSCCSVSYFCWSLFLLFLYKGFLLLLFFILFLPFLCVFRFLYFLFFFILDYMCCFSSILRVFFLMFFLFVFFVWLFFFFFVLFCF